MNVFMLIVSVGVGIYGLYCGFHMRAFIGTGHYWSNVWFYKAHACLFALVIMRLLTPRGRDRSEG